MVWGPVLKWLIVMTLMKEYQLSWRLYVCVLRKETRGIV
jgi:hypothetical protein